MTPTDRTPKVSRYVSVALDRDIVEKLRLLATANKLTLSEQLETLAGEAIDAAYRTFARELHAELIESAD